MAGVTRLELATSGVTEKNTLKTRGNQHPILALQTSAETVVLFNRVQHENWPATQLATQPIPRPAIP